MNVKFRLFALAAMVLLTLAACGDSKDKIGGSVKGKRIAILDQSHKIEADKELNGMQPKLPPIQVVKGWLQSGYSTANMMPNAALDPHPKEIWRASVGEGSDSDFHLLSKPVTGQGMLFTMDAEGLVRAFDANTGERKWDFDTTPEDHNENAAGGGIALDLGTLYATNGFGQVLAINAANGQLKWRKQLLNPIRAAPTIAGGHVYVVSIDNELQALDANNGNEMWHHRGITESATLMGASNPAVTGDGVVVAYSSGEIFNLRPENGRVAWSYTLTVPTQVGAMPAIADIRGLPVVDESRVYAISQSGRIAAIDDRTGDRAWEADIGGVNTPLLAGDTIFVVSNDMQLVALARDSGRVMWVVDLPKFEDPEDHDSDRVLWTGPVLAANHLWLVNTLGQLISYDSSNGKAIDTIALSGSISIPPIISNNTMYVMLDSGKIVALR